MVINTPPPPQLASHRPLTQTVTIKSPRQYVTCDFYRLTYTDPGIGERKAGVGAVRVNSLHCMLLCSFPFKQLRLLRVAHLGFVALVSISEDWIFACFVTYTSNAQDVGLQRP